MRIAESKLWKPPAVSSFYTVDWQRQDTGPATLDNSREDRERKRKPGPQETSLVLY